MRYIVFIRIEIFINNKVIYLTLLFIMIFINLENTNKEIYNEKVIKWY